MKKIFKKIAVMFSAVATLSLFSPCVALETSAEGSFNTEVKESVCVVAEYISDTSGSSEIAASGTGFFVGTEGENPQYLITNCHVVADYVGLGEGDYLDNGLRMGLRVYYGKDEYEEAYVVDSDSTRDIAIVKLDKPTDKRQSIKLRAVDDSAQGEKVFCVGFPGDADNLALEAVSKWGKDDATVTTGTISRLLTLSNHAGEKAIQTDAEINHGNSGGPMVDIDGNAIGINTWSINKELERNIYYAINIEEAMAFLNRNNIAYQTAGNEDVTESEESSGNNMGIIVIVAVVAVAAVAVFVVIKKKSGGNETKSSGGNAKGIVYSMAAQHGGKSYPVGKSPVMIGRDVAGCAIVYKEGTAGVSSRHCTVSFDPSSCEFTVTDLKSSFGTFLSKNGQKIPPNTPVKLKAGESFYVGDKANLIIVELEKQEK